MEIKRGSKSYSLAGEGRVWVGLVRTQKEHKLARDTYFLEREEIITWKDSKPARDTYNLKSQGLRLVRTCKESKSVRGTHYLERAEFGTG